MIALDRIILQRGPQRLLEDTSARIFPGRRVGLIGANGSGKTSLFRLLLGELTADGGEVRVPDAWRLAHMAQEVVFSDRTAVDFVIDGDARLRRVESGIQRAEADRAHEALAGLYAEWEAMHGYQARSRAEQLLHGLGFDQSQVERPVSDFSGGWRIRLNLARALMCPSDLLLLDEPTNHLDLDATLWLEQWLKAYEGTLLLISHDRDFLDNVVTDVLHIEHQALNHYRGGYSDFEQQRAARLAQQQALYEKQQKRVAEITRFVDRFRAKATKARQAQSRLKELARMQAAAPAHVDSPFYFQFKPADRQSDPLVDLREARLGYGGTTILDGVKLRLQPGSRLGLLGMNGAGKSTLIKALVGELPLQAGERVRGDHLAVGYFAQHQLEALDVNASAADHLQRLAPGASEQSIRNFLGGFDFHGDKALKPIKPFSGGEKARLALAIIVWQRPNLLLLDEPTNHLDLEMRHALTVALQSFTGALVVISHDRHLLRNTVDEYLLVDDGTVRPFDGTLADYHRWLKERTRSEAADTIGKNHKAAADGDNDRESKKARRQQAAEQRLRRQPLNREIQSLEKNLASVQAQLAEIETELAEPGLYDECNKARLQALLQAQGELRKTAESGEAKWMTLQEKLEAME